MYKKKQTQGNKFNVMNKSGESNEGESTKAS